MEAFISMSDPSVHTSMMQTRGFLKHEGGIPYPYRPDQNGYSLDDQKRAADTMRQNARVLDGSGHERIAELLRVPLALAAKLADRRRINHQSIPYIVERLDAGVF
jgi:hypothetical protein